MSAGAWLGPVIIAAVIAGLVNVAGWYVTYDRERRHDLRRRSEKVRDYMTALRAEIRCHNFRWTGTDPVRHVQEMAEKIRAARRARRNFTPFTPKEPANSIYAAVTGEIHLLPGEVIDPVIRFYRQAETIAQLIEDIRAEDFRKLDPERKIAIYKDYIDLRVKAGQLANDAVAALQNVRNLE